MHNRKKTSVPIYRHRKVQETTQKPREAMILDAAREWILKDGFATLTMDKLAAKLPFSKGTLYNHFASIDDLLVVMTTRCMEQHHQAFARSALFRGISRERFAAMAVACEVLELAPEAQVDLEISDAILERCSPEARAAFRAAHLGTVSVMTGIVRDAIAAGDLPARCQPECVAYGTWSIYVGTESLYDQGLIFNGDDPNQFREHQRAIADAFLDGLGWKPMSHDMDFPALRLRVLKEIFVDEARQAGWIE